MKTHLLTNLVLTSILIISCSKNNESYYPIKEGSSKEYSVSTQGSFGNNSANVKISFLDKTKIGDIEVIPEMMSSPNGTMTQYLANDKNGIYIYATKNSFQAEPIVSKELSYIMKNDIKEGDSWKNGNDEVVEVIKTDETVIVPAGTFKNCLRLNMISKNITTQTWYSKGIGMVKNITNTKDVFSSTNMSMELTNY